jgi:dTMP kinase
VFVVVEGIEGSGKSTLIYGLAERLRSEGHDVVVTREPGGTAAGDAIREIFLNRAIEITPLAESLLVNAARAQHVSAVIRPMLESGRIVLCDRFTDSTLAYQGYGRGLDLGALRSICRIATAGVEPNLVLVLDAPTSIVHARLRERSTPPDRIEAEGEAFHERVRQGFLTLASGSPRHRVIDGTWPRERVLEEAMQLVRAGLGVRVT